MSHFSVALSFITDLSAGNPSAKCLHEMRGLWKTYVSNFESVIEFKNSSHAGTMLSSFTEILLNNNFDKNKHWYGGVQVAHVAKVHLILYPAWDLCYMSFPTLWATGFMLPHFYNIYTASWQLWVYNFCPPQSFDWQVNSQSHARGGHVVKCR